MESSVDIGSYTTMPRKRRDRLPTAEELQEMSLERRLATLNISQSRTPVPPPRSRKSQKRLYALPDKMATSPSKSPELYSERDYSFDRDPRYISNGDKFKQNGYTDYRKQKTTRQSYQKYEIPRKDIQQDQYTNSQPMCDIIQSSQQTSCPQILRRPDILRGSFKADIQSRLANDLQYMDKSHHHTPKPNHINDTENLTNSGRHPQNKTNNKQSRNGKHEGQARTSRSGTRSDKRSHVEMPSPEATSTPNLDKPANSNNRFMFYRPKIDSSMRKQHSVIGLSGMAEVYKGGNLRSPEGSFINPAFEIVDLPTKLDTAAAQAKKSVRKSSKPVYSTMGSSYSTRPCTPSPPSHRFRNQKPPLPSSPEPKISPVKPSGPTPIKPMLSAQSLETSLKQYSSPRKLNTSDMCTSEALENMMKYYNMKDNSDSSTPSPAKLSSSKKNQSPYSSTGSLNVSGDSIDVVLRRKKKVKIRPLSISSDDESVKRVSLEINLAPTTNQSEEDIGADPEFTRNLRGSLSASQTSLNQTVEKLDLDDLTSTETAKLLRKQFAKLKVKASSLKVKDTELKQRFALLQNQRGRVCGHGGVTKTKIRSSPILL